MTPQSPSPTRLSRRTALRLAVPFACAMYGGLRPATVHAQSGTATEQSAPLPVGLPAELLAEAPALRALGNARMRFFGLDIYDARLWVGPDFKPATYWQSAFALELNYFRSLSGKAIASRSLKEMQRQGAMTSTQETVWLNGMELAFPDVRAGDRIVGAHTPGAGARFWFNGQPRPAVKDAEFSRQFFGIWLADATSEPKLRTQMLGQSSP